MINESHLKKRLKETGLPFETKFNLESIKSEKIEIYLRCHLTRTSASCLSEASFSANCDWRAIGFYKELFPIIEFFIPTKEDLTTKMI